MLPPLFRDRNKTVAFLGVLMQVGLAQSAFCTPVPANATGSLSPGQTITVTGTAFGSTGPHVVMLEDFERDTAGQKVQLSGAPVGNWTGYVTGTTFLASPNAHTGHVGLHAYDKTDANGNVLSLVLNGQYQEAFISTWVEVPSGATFPGNYGPGGPGSGPPGSDQFSYDSSWKFAWLLQDPSAYQTSGQYDMVNMSYAGEDQFIPDGSNKGYEMCVEPGSYCINANSIGTSWWSWTGWNRVVTWLRGNSTVPAGAPGGMIQTLNAEHGMTTWEIGNPVSYPTSAMFQDGVGNYFTQINVPGWIRENSGPNADPTYDDIYIAVGPGAAARVEITDSPVYSQSHHATILKVSNWSDGSITAAVPSAGLDFSGPAYLYVTDANGNTSAAGLPVVASTGTSASYPPNPPGNIVVK